MAGQQEEGFCFYFMAEDKKMNSRLKWALPVSGGILAALPWWGAPGILLMVAFALLFLTEERLQREGEPVLSLLPQGFTFFLLWNLIATWWIARIHFLGGMSVIVLNAVLMSLVFLLYSGIKRRTGTGPVVFVLLWTGFEFIHHRGDLSWPWLTLGNGLASDIRLVQWYEFTGPAGGSLWVLLCSAMLFSIIKHYCYGGSGAHYLRIPVFLVLLAFPAAISLYSWYTFVEEDADTGFLILQPGLDPYGKKFSGISNHDRLGQLLDLATENMDERVNYVVSPETSVDSLWITDPENPLAGEVYRFADEYPEVVILLGATTFSSVGKPEQTFTTREHEDGSLFEIQNSVLLFHSGTPLQAYHKHYLANGVEQLPFQDIFGFIRRFSLDLGGVSGSMKRGDGAGVFRSPAEDSLVTGTLICFESAYGEYAARMAGMGAEVLVVVSNDGWFKNTGAYRQHLRLSQIRAVETRRYLVRAANTGVSCLVSPRGVITASLGWWEEGALFVSAGRSSEPTFYAARGDYIGRTAIFFSILLILNYLVSFRRG